MGWAPSVHARRVTLGFLFLELANDHITFALRIQSKYKSYVAEPDKTNHHTAPRPGGLSH